MGKAASHGKSFIPMGKIVEHAWDYTMFHNPMRVVLNCTIIFWVYNIQDNMIIIEIVVGYKLC